MAPQVALVHVLDGVPAIVLARLEDGDPLRLFERAALCLRRAWYLVDAERVRRRSANRIAILAPLGAASSRPDAWVEARVEESIEACVNEDRGLARARRELAQERRYDYTFLCWMFGLATEHALTAAVAFNGMPPVVRRTFFALAIEGFDVQACIAAGLGSRETLREHLRVVLASVRVTSLGDAQRSNHEADTCDNDETAHSRSGARGAVGWSSARRTSRVVARRTGCPPRSAVFERRIGRQHVDEPCRRGEASLGSAHREEVASLLRAMCLRRLSTDPAWVDYTGPHITAERELAIPDPSELSARRALLNAVHASSAVDPSLQTAFAEDADSHLTVAQLAEISLRFEPSDTAVIHMAIDLHRRGNSKLATQHMARLLSRGSSAVLESYAEELLGFIEASGLRFDSAREAYARAAQLDETRVGPLFSWLELALRTEQMADVREAAARLERALRPDHAAIEHYLRSRHALRSAGRLKWSARAVDFARQVRDHVGPSATRVVGAFI